MSTPMIELDNLSRCFGDQWAVRDLSLSVPTGELFCFLGPNGAGKTTTIKMITGLLRPSNGTIHVNGIDLAADPLRVKQKIGYIPDTPYLYERLTSSEFFDFTGELYGIEHDRIRQAKPELFEQFGLNEHADHLVRDLSHGLRQRLLYAVSFLHHPLALFIDEPLIGLDPYTIRLIKDLLKRKTRDGMTVFLTTHILALAEDIADRIGIINHGRLCALGSLDDLRAQSGIDGSLEDVFLHLTSS